MQVTLKQKEKSLKQRSSMKREDRNENKSD